MKLIQKLSVLFLMATMLALPLGVSAAGGAAEEFDAIAMLTAAGLIDEEDATQDEGTYVSRAELAVLAARLRGIEPMSQAYYELPVFYDVEKDYYEAGYIHAATLSGLIEPVEAGYFKPTEAATSLVTVKSLLTVLGYHSSVAKYGDTAASWMTVAGKVGLLGSLHLSANDAITRGELYRLVANSLDVDVITEELVSGDKVQMSTVKGRNFLEAYHNIYMADGVVTDDGRSALDTEKSRIGTLEWLIDGVCCNAEAVSGEELLGYRVRAYYRDVAGDKQIFYVAPYRNEVLCVDAEDILSYQSRTYRYTEEDSDRVKTISTSQATVLYNGVCAEGMSFTAIPSVGSVTAVDNDKDGHYEVIRIESYKDCLAEGVDTAAEVVYIKNDKAIRFDAYDRYCVINAQTGAVVGIGGITKGAVLTVAEDLHKQSVTIYVSTQTVSGKITSVEQNGKHTDFVVNDATYRTSVLYENRIAKGQTGRPSAGNKAIFYLNKFGKIADSKQQSDFLSSYQYGIVLAAKTGTFGDDVQLQIFSELGVMEAMSVAKKPYVDEQRVENANALLKALYQLGENGVQEAALVPQLIRFKTDSMGVLTHIDRFGTEPTADKSLYLVKDSFDVEYGQGYSSAMQTIRYGDYSDAYALGNIDAVFTVPVSNGRVTKESDDLYSRDSLGKFSNGDKIKFQLYKTDPDILSQEVMLVPVEIIGGKAVKKVAEEATVNVFLKSEQTVDRAGDICTSIRYSADGSEKTAVLADDVDINALIQSDGSTYRLGSGDVFRFGTDTQGKINMIEVAYSLAEDRFMPTTTANTLTDQRWLPNECMCLQRFGLETYDGSYMRAAFGDPRAADYNDPSTFSIISLERLNLSNVMVYDKTRQTVRKATTADLRGYSSVGEDYASGVIYKRYSDPKKLVLYQ